MEVHHIRTHVRNPPGEGEKITRDYLYIPKRNVLIPFNMDSRGMHVGKLVDHPYALGVAKDLMNQEGREYFGKTDFHETNIDAMISASRNIISPKEMYEFLAEDMMTTISEEEA
jgi:hypothetical protein